MIELLVVIAIIGLLAAMLLPALKSAREKARSAICISNLRQLNLTMQFYADDAGRYVGGDDPTMVWPHRRWQNVLVRNKYVTGAENNFPAPHILKCPSDPKVTTASFISYRVNGGVQGGSSLTPVNWEPEGIVYQRPDTIFYPDRTAMFFEGGRPPSFGGTDWDNGYSGHDTGIVDIGGYPSGAQAKIMRWHGWCNVIFVDGHYETFASDMNPSVAGIQPLPLPGPEGATTRQYFWGTKCDGSAPFVPDQPYGW